MLIASCHQPHALPLAPSRVLTNTGLELMPPKPGTVAHPRRGRRGGVWVNVIRHDPFWGSLWPHRQPCVPLQAFVTLLFNTAFMTSFLSTRLWAAWCAATVCLGAQAAPLPHRAEIHYAVHWGPATVEAIQQWQHDGHHYQLDTELKLPFPFKSRRYLSQGDLTAQGLQPAHYDEYQVGDPQVRHQALFQRSESQLRYGEPPELKKTLALDASAMAAAQDLNALPFQLTFLGAKTAGTHMVVTNAKGVVAHHFEAVPAQAFQWQGQPLETLRFVSHASDGELEVWLAPSLGYLPVVVIRGQDGQQLRFEARSIQTTP